MTDLPTLKLPVALWSRAASRAVVWDRVWQMSRGGCESKFLCCASIKNNGSFVHLYGIYSTRRMSASMLSNQLSLSDSVELGPSGAFKLVRHVTSGLPRSPSWLTGKLSQCGRADDLWMSLADELGGTASAFH